jgi:hypothetical protein
VSIVHHFDSFVRSLPQNTADSRPLRHHER